MMPVIAFLVAFAFGGSSRGAADEKPYERLEKGETVHVENPDAVDKTVRKWTFEDKSHFGNAKELVAAFERHVLYTEFIPVTSNGNKYIFVAAYPYSGVNGMQLYCYREYRTEWNLCLVTFLQKLLPMKVTVLEKIGVIDVRNGDATILVINAGRDNF
ncbi:MAG: hypothetical protein ABSA67_07360 [Candidatus Brocadiia bacterium]|jgi:hypothetical protein